MKALLVVVFMMISAVGFASDNNFESVGRGKNLSTAKWNAIQSAFLECEGSAKSVDKFESKKIKNPTCPDPRDCDEWVEAKATFQCL